MIEIIAIIAAIASSSFAGLKFLGESKERYYNEIREIQEVKAQAKYNHERIEEDAKSKDRRLGAIENRLSEISRKVSD